METRFNYYDLPEYNEQRARAAAKAGTQTKTSRWFRSETEAAYNELMAANQAPAAHKKKLEDKYVALRTEDGLNATSRKEFAAVVGKLHPQAAKRFNYVDGDVHLVEGAPHLGYKRFAQTNLVYPDGTVSVVNFYKSNFEATFEPKNDGIAYKGIPPQIDPGVKGGTKNKPLLFCSARIKNADGTPGALDPRFMKDGVAYSMDNLHTLANEWNKIAAFSVKSEVMLARANKDPKARAPGIHQDHVDAEARRREQAKAQPKAGITPTTIGKGPAISLSEKAKERRQEREAMSQRTQQRTNERGMRI